MNKEELRQLHKIHYKENLEKRFGRTDFEILEFKSTKDPASIKCLRCDSIMVHRADSWYEKKSLCKCDRKPALTQAGKEAKHKFQYWFSTQGYKRYDLIQDFYSLRLPVTLRCKKCGKEQNRTVKELLKDDRCLCCERKIIVKKTNEQFIKEVEDFCGDEYTFIEEYDGINTPILVRHNTCGKIIRVKPSQFLAGKNTCPFCHTNSKGEKKIERLLDKNHIPYIKQFRIETYRRAPFDFFLPNYNLLIEFQGIQHFGPVQQFGGQRQFERQQIIDTEKKAKAEALEYTVVYFSYQDYSILDDIVVQRLSEYGVEFTSK